jgi:molecular chaperone GrpE
MKKRKKQPEDEPEVGTEQLPQAEASAPGEAETEAGDASQDEAEKDPEQQLLELEGKWLRARADLDNARRRARLDVEEARTYAGTALLQSLLPVLDALQRALASAPEGADDPILEGLRLTEQQFVGVLASHGVTPVAAEPGTPCDPTIHRVLLEQTSDTHAPGQIVTEIARGYMLHDRLLREAQVAVASRPDPADAETPDADV